MSRIQKSFVNDEKMRKKAIRGVCERLMYFFFHFIDVLFGAKRAASL